MVTDVNGNECTVKSLGEPEGFTPDEPWQTEWPLLDSPHPYPAAAIFALRGLGLGPGSPNQERCLTVGSTVFEARMLRGHRWLVTMLDVRKPPMDDVPFVKGDAIAMPFANESFSALSSTCCLCHVGLGRYGDALAERGDYMALKEFARVLKTGCKASVMFGPCVPNLAKSFVLGTTHRVYAVEDVGQMVRNAGFEIEMTGMWCSAKRRWMTQGEVHDRRTERIEVGTLFPYCYLAMILEKQ